MMNKVLSTVAIVGVILLFCYEWWHAIQLNQRFSSFVNKGARWQPAEVGAVVEKLLAERVEPRKVWGS